MKCTPYNGHWKNTLVFMSTHLKVDIEKTREIRCAFKGCIFLWKATLADIWVGDHAKIEYSSENNVNTMKTIVVQKQK